ncbi:Nmad2 family putative nucleotide modification protein [Parapedobacter koreensis]|nr:hypothetical protein [Parapedobacter koreensis]
MSIMGGYAYKITRDYGFAPNPFGEYCSLACCKPNIRKKAAAGDLIIGTGAKANDLLYHLIFIMRVTEKLTFQEYWEDKRFAYKKPVLNGSRKQVHGDNIYHNVDDVWCQLDSHHSRLGGEVNEGNLKQDLRGEYILLSNSFVYLGDQNMEVPQKYRELCPSIKHRDYITIRNTELAEEFFQYTVGNYGLGVIGDPVNWKEYD